MQNDSPDVPERLEELRRAVRAGVVPGELRAWCTDVAGGLGPLPGMLELRLDELAAALARDAESQPGLAAQVTRLRSEGRRLIGRVRTLERRLEGILRQGLRRTDSGENLSSLRRLRRDLAVWWSLWDLLEGDADTWIAEATTRDEGAGG